VSVKFLKNIAQIEIVQVEHKITIENSYFLRVTGLTAVYCMLYTSSGHTDLSNIYIYISTVKGKAIQLQALTGPKGSRRLRLTDFKTIGT
jgi:hypothetical protein